MKYEFPTSIADGAKLLDKTNPGWYDIIDLDNLNMRVYDTCILGQLFGDYAVGMKKLFGGYSGPDSVFGGRVNPDSWKSEILNRRTNLSSNRGNFIWACKKLIEGYRVRDESSSDFLPNGYVELVNNNIIDENGDIVDITFRNSQEIVSCTNENSWVIVPKNPKFKELELGDKFKLRGEEYTKVSGPNGEWCGLLGNCCYVVSPDEEVEKI